ncbi:MAG TPA: hypothetical protein VEK85_11025 [Gemmatimonadales bacterium]|nr:hypothetical protein [Gemmatimonadales bacterium]
MIVPRVHRPRRTAPLAALLLVIQGIAGGVVPLAHASERFTAPAHIEAQHGSGCLALHDELRCVLCHYAATRVTTQQPRLQPAATTASERPRERFAIAPIACADHLTAPPRAPPSRS